MDNIDDKALENKTLDPEALKGVSGGIMMTENEMWNHVVYQCLGCDYNDETCKALLDRLNAEFKAAKPGTKLDVVCPKGLLSYTEIYKGEL